MKASIQAIYAAAIALAGCQSLPPLPPPGPVTTAAQAVVIAAYHCGRQRIWRDLMAERDLGNWDVTENSAPIGLNKVAEVRASDAKVDCDETVIVAP